MMMVVVSSGKRGACGWKIFFDCLNFLRFAVE